MMRKVWAQKEEYRRLPLACVGGPLYAISPFWLVKFTSHQVYCLEYLLLVVKAYFWAVGGFDVMSRFLMGQE